ncbi:MAG: hypothetical protein GF331_01330, partial [Chitinivibrionales bacterium]|nr:hypothetical protein [Chitinivibrionales bacterium]
AGAPGAGAGSGGSVHIDVDSLLGSGSISADGGTGTANGGGGRVAVYVYEHFAMDTSAVTASADASKPYPCDSVAEHGTVVFGSGAADSLLVVLRGLRAYRSSEQVDLSGAEFSHQRLAVSNTVLDLTSPVAIRGLEVSNSIVRFDETLNVDTLLAYGSTLEMKRACVVRDTLAMTSSSAAFGDGLLVEGNATILATSRLTTREPTLEQQYILSVSVHGALMIDSSSAIEVTAMGYRGAVCQSGECTEARTVGNVAGSASAMPGSPQMVGAGSHGGLGSARNPAYRNQAYGNFLWPRSLGSGGGAIRGWSSYGGNGGGALDLAIGMLHCDGTIAADGGPANNGAGGSGGSILIDALRVTGSGIVRADGSLGASGFGAGGGGRVAIRAESLSDSLEITAYGGDSAGCGSVFLLDSSRSPGVLLFDNHGFETLDNSTVLPAVPEGTITALAPDTLTDTGASFSQWVSGHRVKPNFGFASPAHAYRIIDAEDRFLVVDTTEFGTLYTDGCSVGDPYIGVYQFDTIVVKGGANVYTEGLVFYNTMYLDNGSFTSYTGTQTGLRHAPAEDMRYGRATPPVNERRAERAVRRAQRRERHAMERLARKAAREKRHAEAVEAKADTETESVQSEASPPQVATAGVSCEWRAAGPFKPRFAEPHERFAGSNSFPAGTPQCTDGDPVYTYDKLDRVTSMTSPVGTTNYEYDPVTGRLTKIVSPEGKEFIFSYDRGQLETLSRPNGIVTHYAFDDNGNLTVLDHRLGASSVARYDYTYDANGMRTSMTDLDGLHDYAYDTLYQIIQATHPTVTNPTEVFEYDAAGNRLFDEERAYSYNELNQLVEDDEHWYEYDLDGNMALKVEKVSGDSTEFFWDIENRLVRVEKPGTVAEYSYGPLGRRLAKTVNGITTEFRYDGEDLILELDGAGNIAGSWTFGPGIDQPLAMNRGGTHHYYLADGLGSVMALTNETGAVVQTYEYGVFGEIAEKTGSLENPFAYTGREWEPEVGLHYYRARWYDGKAGRFLSEDPIGVLSYDGPNVYLYARNSPVLFLDPFGLQCGSGWNDPIVAEKGFGWDFTEACQKHDECYGDGAKTRKQCDDEFKSNMMNSCKDSYTEGTRADCERNARTYYNAVRMFGGSKYKPKITQDTLGATPCDTSGGVKCPVDSVAGDTAKPAKPAPSDTTGGK